MKIFIIKTIRKTCHVILIGMGLNLPITSDGSSFKASGDWY